MAHRQERTVVDLPAPVSLLGVHVHPVVRSQLIDVLTTWAEAPPPQRMYYTNAHVFNLASRRPRFLSSLNQADLVICEGIGGRVGGAVAGVHLPEQLATMDWIDEFLARLADGGQSLFLLGDEPGVADVCARAMVGRHPALRICGTHHGFFHKDADGNRRVVEKVNASGTDVLFVGMGNPVQEHWIDKHLEVLDVNLILSLGAMFRWYTGVERRAPGWMRALGLEWLLRLIKHPVRYFDRYVIGNPLFLARCLAERISGAAGRRDHG